MDEIIRILVFFAFAWIGSTYCYLNGKRRGRKRGYEEGYEEGFNRGLNDRFHEEQGKAIIDMLRNNVAKKIEEKIRNERS